MPRGGRRGGRGRDIVVSSALEERVNPVGELDGSIRCSVQINQSRVVTEAETETERRRRQQQCQQQRFPSDNSAEEVAEEVEEEVEEEEKAVIGRLHISPPSSPPSSPSGHSPHRMLDFTQTVQIDMNEVNEYFKMDECVDPPTPDHGMGSTQSVREYNTLAESDSVNEIFLCSIEEEIPEEEEECECEDLLDSSVEEEEGGLALQLKNTSIVDEEVDDGSKDYGEDSIETLL
jgi:hypothetical protein